LDARFDKSKTNDFTFDKLKDFDTIGKEPKTDKIDGEISLDKCLESFSSPEVLEAGNEWYCPKCKEHKLARK
jgi:ubiquitin C-terminal hydrolase